MARNRRFGESPATMILPGRSAAPTVTNWVTGLKRPMCSAHDADFILMGERPGHSGPPPDRQPQI